MTKKRRYTERNWENRTEVEAWYNSLSAFQKERFKRIKDLFQEQTWVIKNGQQETRPTNNNDVLNWIIAKSSWKIVNEQWARWYIKKAKILMGFEII